MKRAMRRRKTWQRQAAAITAAMMAMSVGGIAYAMPQGEVIRSGKGEITRQDKDMTVNQDSKRLAIDWSGFDIANDERVTFRQPDKDSVALNRVVGDAASVIDGTLSGNGHVYVINPNGVLFGKNASVDVGSLVASTAKLSDSDMTNFADANGITMAIPEDSSAKVINAGTIRAEGGLVVLHAAEVENSGTITNPEGTTALAAARNLSLSADTAGKINFTVDGALAKAKALNSGVLKADGGYLVMTARSAGDVMSTVVNNTGTMEAKTLRQNEKGEILLDGGDNGIVELNGTLDVSGMEAGQSAGSIKAIGAETHVEDGATLHAIGAVDGGLIETSGDYLEIGDNVDIDAAGKTGKAGEWLLDPTKVIISDEGDSNVTGSNRYTRGTTYLKTSSITNVLKKNNVKIQATDSTYHNADISLDSALNVDETTAGKNTLTLEAEENININADINATAALNVVLNADTNRDDKGGVNINADIRTGGGSLMTGANGATFFGGTNSGKNNRVIETSGGDVNIQNEARLQLNGGTLSINSAGGNVNFARNVASMNKYEAFMDHDFLAGKHTDQATAWENMLRSMYGKYYTNDSGQRVQFIVDGQSDYESLTLDQKNKASNMLAQTWEFADIAARLNNIEDPDGKKLNGQHLVTITDKYENSAAMANAVKKTGNVVEYFTGGKDVTGRTGEAAYRTDGRTFAWVTGPEAGTAFYKTTGEGRGYELNGNYTNWVRNEPIDPRRPWEGSYNEPNNNRGGEHQPYVAIGWTDQNGWDDVGNGAGTVHGFIRETELPNSALSINSGAGKVTVGTEGVADTGRLGSGEGTGLRNLSIETTKGDVKVLGSIYVHDNHANAAADLANGNVKIATQGNVDVGQITADKKVEIATTGADKAVTVNGKIATDGLVSIEATDDITVHGIENGDKIRLISTNPNGDGAITLANNAEGGGALITKSKANDAVIIDVQGKNGSFQNLTTAEKAITTGEGGNWKVYSASPDRDTFGTNLNSETTARWHASSQGGNGLYAYDAETEDTNKYIFQTQPTLTITADNKEKTYGETVELTAQKKVEFIDKDGNPHDVTGYTDAFKEVSEGGSIMDRYTGNYTLTSAGQAASATRTNGDRQADDGERAIYDINVDTHSLQGLEGYAVGTPNKGALTINRRTVVLNGSASQTYGDATLRDKGVYAETGTEGQGVTNGDELDTSGVEYTISPSDEYAASKNAHVNGVTADAGTYNDELLFSNVHFTNKADANYAVTGNGDITVDKHTITRDELGLEGSPLFETVYGTKPDDLGKATFNAVNGDGSYELNITGTNALTGNDTGRVTNDFGSDYYTTVALSDALSKNYKFDNGETSKDFANTASVTKAKLTITTKDLGDVEYGDVDTIKNGLINAGSLDGLVNGDDENIVSTVNGTTDALTDGGKHTNNVKDGGYTIEADLSSLSDKSLNTLNKNYEITRKEGKVNLTRKQIELITDDITTTYGDGNTILNQLNNNLLHLKGLVNDDNQSTILDELGAHITVKNNKSAFKQNPDGTIMTDAVTGQHYTSDVGSYSITTGAYLAAETTNYEVVAGENAAGHTVGKIYVEKAPLTVNRTGYETTYGTVITDDAEHRFTTWSGLVNGDVDDIYINYGDYGGAYKDNNTRTNDADTYRFHKNLQSATNVLRNYEVNDTQKNWVKINPYALTDADILNATYTTEYGSRSRFSTAKLKNINGDGELDLRIVGSSALTGKTKGRVTEDVGQNIYNTVVSLDNIYGADGFDLKNYTLNGKALGKNDRMTIANSASVTPADLVITRKGIDTVYGTVKTDDGTMTTYKLVNGDTDDIAINNGNYGTAYNDDLTKTNNVGKYDYKATLNSASDVLRNYNVHDDGMNYVNITPLNITEDNVNDFITNATYTTVYGSKADFGQAVFTGKNGDGTRELSITGSSALTGNTEGVITKDAAENAYNTVVSLDGLSAQDKKNYGLADTSSFTFDNSATVEKADLTVSRKGIETVYGTVKKDPGDMTTYTTLVNGDTNDIVIDNGNYGTAYNDELTKTNNVGKYNYKATLNSESDVLRNYNVHDDGTNYVNITPLNITEDNVNDFITNATYTTVYGSKADFGQAVFTGVNGDGTRDLSITGSSALTGNTEGVITKDAAENAYNTVVSLDGLSEQDKKNYGLEDTSSFTFDNSATVEKADLTVSRKGIETVYGTVKKDPGDMTTYTKLVNGDTNDIVIDNGNYGTAYNDELTKTNNVGKYNYKATLNSESDVLRNYNVHDDGTNYVNITPYTITEQEVVNLDGSPLYTTKYGQKDAFGTATFTGVNGDGTYELAITDSSALATAGAGKVTKDVGKNIYDTTVELSEAMNGNYQFADGATSKTFEKTASVTPAELTIKTKDVETEYGTVKMTTSEVDGLRNGDLPTGFIYDYGNYGGAYLDGNTKTNDVNTYHFGTTLSGAEFLKNYTITGGEADVKIDPKDITFFVSGTGNTLTDVTYTVDPDIDAQLAYGEHVDADYTPGNDLGSNQYGVVAHINGTPIVTGDVAGNYRYNYGGLITLSPTVPTKPDIDPHNPSNLDGSGSWTSNMGNHGVPGVERVAGLASAELPFFKVEAGQVSHYGTYDVAADPDKVRLEPTGKRLPEPNQPKTQYREYTKALTTTDGTGMFRMVYDGSTFNITSVDDGALALMRMGDVKNNVELSAEALHAGFSEMGILLEDLDGVYVHFDTMA